MLPVILHEGHRPLQVLQVERMRFQRVREGFVQVPGGHQAEAQQRVDELGASVADERVRQEGREAPRVFHGVQRDSDHSHDLEGGKTGHEEQSMTSGQSVRSDASPPARGPLRCKRLPSPPP